ncbi:formylglycine-generating enzyme family protein [Rubrivirga sp.]|uniref:formylglycine-generating enzyme family protein n=1 Tax=Rubrivirga sp. TaxID=1885344 RepID=UPI003B51D360
MSHRLALVLALALAACADDSASPSASVADDPAPVDLAVPDGVVVPATMAYVPGGTTRVGVLAGEGGMPHERPAFEATVAPFLLDRSPVTVARFRAFVDATGHQTQAEAFGDGAVMDQAAGAWGLVAGADWRRPRGPEGGEAPDDHPVTQVSWTDAAAFCTWDGAQSGAPGRLPTEVEWEHAARGAGDDRSPYAWGDDLNEGGRLRANTWTGSFPGGDDGADGFRDGTSPVGAFGATPLGLTDLGGNVWEWTASWYQPYPLGADGGTTRAVAGLSGEPERVQRGGSFLCHPSYCHGYRVSARSHATPESSFAHVGFRCARDVPAVEVAAR